MHPATPVISITRVMWSDHEDGIAQHVQHCPLVGHG
jgi:hypothetical protein